MMNSQKINTKGNQPLYFALIVAVILSMSSCDVMKQSAKSKGEASGSEQLESYRKRKGDTVSYKPQLNYKFKDTTIYTVNREGTTLRTVYDERGQVSNIDCFASAIEEMNKSNREFFEQWKDKEKTKTEEFDSSFILYIISGIVVLGMFGFFLVFKLMSKNTAALNQLIQTVHGRTTP